MPLDEETKPKSLKFNSFHLNQNFSYNISLLWEVKQSQKSSILYNVRKQKME